ncbi:GTPase ObgE [Chloroflexia bacterium SDU3-3]|nr:GTPase ObgE [Chloroflexia bacterium SDU3-3]
MSAEFFDRAQILVRAGTGGDGMATFRREKFVPRGGPDGGDGGRGGSVYLVVDKHLNTLQRFQNDRKFVAKNGDNGGSTKKHGRNGDDLFIPVPPGTVVRTEIDGQVYEVDLEQPGMRLLAARGGKGGLGNVHFTTSTHQAPKIAELGEPGQELTLELELKLIADVGLVGFPNAGKSSLISAVSAARPKIANYPFTTLQPNLGVALVGDFSFVIADIPGIIEGAHQGVGLGFDFLRHIERTGMLIHVVDAAGTDGRDPVEDYRIILNELNEYQPELAERPRMVALNKADLPEAEEHIPRLREVIELPPEQVFTISAATRQGTDELIRSVAGLLAQSPRQTSEVREELLEWNVPVVDDRAYSVEQVDGGYRVEGKRIERLVSMTNFAQPESLLRLQRVLEATGITRALLAAGVKEGDTVFIEKAELLWSDEYGA